MNWLQRFGTFSFLDNHEYPTGYPTVECLAAAGVKRELNATAGNALPLLQEFISEKKCWLFGHLGYDLKNEIERLHSSHASHILFPDLYFFEPQVVIRLSPGKLLIDAVNAAQIFSEIKESKSPPPVEKHSSGKIHIQSRQSREEYIAVINKLKEHIRRGDCYEINYCQEFFSDAARVNPLSTYKKFSEISPNPFSACYRVKDQWLLCASPERFIKKEGTRIISQPIKGTSKRVSEDPGEDKFNKEVLANSEKDRAENVMVVDLVRNDLAKLCREGSVKVDELFGIYSFPQVHQMISTISGELREEIEFTDIISACFPMGSMTGAPKKKVMELIESYEPSRRGIFSGTTGYISPSGDFDFNVVIRSIMYNARDNYLSFQAGSGITFNSQPEQEWEECMMKAEAMKKVLEE